MQNRLLAAALAALLLPTAAYAQLRTVALGFKPPADGRVVGFHVYLATAPNGYGDFRDDINYLPPTDASGVATYRLNGLESFSDVYVSLKSYDATGVESAFSNEVVVAAQAKPLPPPECNADADCSAPADPCRGSRVCMASKCQPGTPLADGSACNDADAATRYDVCRAGVCTGFACGSDAQCSDGQACNGTERCDAGACVSGTALQCPTDSGPCFDSFCDAALGCRVQLHPDGSTCLTSVSSTPGTCSAGACMATETRKTHRRGGRWR